MGILSDTSMYQVETFITYQFTMLMEEELQLLRETLSSVKAELAERIRCDREKQLIAAFEFFDLNGDGELNEKEFFHIGEVIPDWNRARDSSVFRIPRDIRTVNQSLS